MSKHLVLIPEYMKTFQCIGPECEDSCCHGFRVELDQPTYLKYSHIKDKDLKRKFSTVLKLIESNRSETEYAYLQYPENMQCPMLSSEGWCTIQQKLGEEALSLTCHSYPRVTNEILDLLEKGATTSCPEVARIALLNKEGISFEQLEEDDRVRNAIGFSMDETSPLVPYFWPLRIFTIELLQNRSYTINERMMILGLFCQKATELVQNNQFESLPSLIEQYKTQYTQTDQFHGILDKLNENPIWQLNVFRKLYKATDQINTLASRYESLRKAAFDGYCIEADNDSDFTQESHATEMNNYLDVLKKWQPIIEKKYEYIFENYLVNSVFINVFPMTGYKSLLEEHMMLAAKYTMIRFMVYGVAAQLQEHFDEHDFIACIQVFSKKIEHSQGFVKYIYDQFKANNCNNLARLALLLKTV